MRKAVFILEAINALLGLIVNMQNLNFLGWPTSTWNGIVYVVFVIGFMALFWSDKELEHSIYRKVMTKVKANLNPPKAPKGSLDSVTSEDRRLIGVMADDMMLSGHACYDGIGMLADRASGVPLNELMTRNCSICGKPRNKPSSGV